MTYAFHVLYASLSAFENATLYIDTCIWYIDNDILQVLSLSLFIYAEQSAETIENNNNYFHFNLSVNAIRRTFKKIHHIMNIHHTI